MKQNYLKSSFLFYLLSTVISLSVPAISFGQCSSNNLAAPYNSNNGSRGAMFNIVSGASAITITSFDVNLYGGTTARYEIYFKAGTFQGFETNAGAWTLAGSVDGLYVPTNNVPTPLPIPLSITIPANSTYGFYITNTASGGLNYTSSATNNVTLASNADLTLIGGVGKAYPFAATYNFRLINCTVYYTKTPLTESSTLSTSNNVGGAILQNSSSTLFGSPCSSLICKVTGTGGSPVGGNTSARVWIDLVQQPQYVKRHYQIAPATNGTGLVTLYFTDAEFNAFNTQTVAPALLLPVSTSPGTIAARKANLRIEKRPGISSDGSGTPNTYSGAVETIDPDDANIVWNAAASRWEVSFNVSSFSGFWAKTSLFSLPLKLVSFNGSPKKEWNELVWKTTDEINTKEFDLERSIDGVSFSSITIIAAKGIGNNSYKFTDNFKKSEQAYYRLKMTDLDGKFAYSNVVLVKRSNGIRKPTISVYPNPIKERVTITISDASLIGSKASITDLNGKTLETFTFVKQSENIDMGKYPPGIYLVRLQNGEVQKMVKK